MRSIFTPFVVRSTLILTGIAIVGGVVNQATVSFQAFANADRATQNSYIQLAAQTSK